MLCEHVIFADNLYYTPNLPTEDTFTMSMGLVTGTEIASVAAKIKNKSTYVSLQVYLDIYLLVCYIAGEIPC